jgi:hypothetical protein
MGYRRLRPVFLISFIAVVACLGWAKEKPTASPEPNWNQEQRTDFLLHAKVVGSNQASKGVTGTYRLMLSDGTITHLASFQPIDERKAVMQFNDGRTELNFKDSYHYNIAAYQLAKLIGLDDIVPVYVERRWNGQVGSLSWWLPGVQFDEGERLKRHVQAPNPDAWNKQMYRVRVLDQLIYDNDPNLTNVLIDANWKLWRIDFSRGFRQQKTLRNPEDLVMCDRQLLDKLRKLDGDELLQATKHHLTKAEVQAVMARRDLIVQTFEKMVAQKGEGAVLY